mmetsp:Transcript_67853/g.112804  ORF Transcript_67853/g.112804 Transcript_67853/m.112804 type:complete len:711 (+) Transcript_67853:127-2259(+)
MMSLSPLELYFGTGVGLVLGLVQPFLRKYLRTRWSGYGSISEYTALKADVACARKESARAKDEPHSLQCDESNCADDSSCRLSSRPQANAEARPAEKVSDREDRAVCGARRLAEVDGCGSRGEALAWPDKAVNKWVLEQRSVYDAVRIESRAFARGLAADLSELNSDGMVPLSASSEFVKTSDVYTRVFDPRCSHISGFIIDLNGTICRPGSLLPGARSFHSWLLRTGKQFVYLSNTGYESSEMVRRKLASPPYQLSAKMLSKTKVFTSADSQIKFLQENIPPSAKLFVLSGGGDFWRQPLRQPPYEQLVDSWDIRTHLSLAEAKEWAILGAAHPKQSVIWVVFFFDGRLLSHVDPNSGNHIGYSDWSFELMTILAILVAHRAELVYTGEDAFSPSLDDEMPGYVWPLPGPGMFAEMLKKITYPLGRDRVHCLGKGGNKGVKYMMEHALELLMQQGHSGDRRDVMIIGDRFDTDVRGGLSIGIQTCLVQSGCHTLELQPFYPDDVVHFVAQDLNSMLLDRQGPVPSEEQPADMNRIPSLREWMLSQGNMVYANASCGHVSISLEHVLQEYYDSVQQGSLLRPGQQVTAKAVLEALAELGIEISPKELHSKLRHLEYSPADQLPFPCFSGLIQDTLEELGVELSGGVCHHELGAQLQEASFKSRERLRPASRSMPCFAVMPSFSTRHQVFHTALANVETVDTVMRRRSRSS